MSRRTGNKTSLEVPRPPSIAARRGSVPHIVRLKVWRSCSCTCSTRGSTSSCKPALRSDANRSSLESTRSRMCGFHRRRRRSRSRSLHCCTQGRRSRRRARIRGSRCTTRLRLASRNRHRHNRTWHRSVGKQRAQAGLGEWARGGLSSLHRVAVLVAIAIAVPGVSPLPAPGVWALAPAAL